MTVVRNPGRIAGFWYLLLTVIGPIRLLYIPSKLFVSGDAAATAKNIAAHHILAAIVLTKFEKRKQFFVSPRIGIGRAICYVRSAKVHEFFDN